MFDHCAKIVATTSLCLSCSTFAADIEAFKKQGITMDGWEIIIPSRLGSTRLQEKALMIFPDGDPLVVKVYKNVKPLEELGAKIIVATDSQKIVEACRAYDIPVTLTGQHRSGSDRVNEAAGRSTNKFILNVQGDEPFVPLGPLVKLAQALMSDKGAAMGTVVYKSHDQKEFLDRNVVKAKITDGIAVDFSRDGSSFPAGEGDGFYKHLGIYAFRKEGLRAFAALPPSKRELDERLEQLRAIEAGWKIVAVESSEDSFGIDTLEDFHSACRLVELIGTK